MSTFIEYNREQVFAYLKRFKHAGDMSFEELRSALIDGVDIDGRYFTKQQRINQKEELKKAYRSYLRTMGTNMQEYYEQMRIIVKGERSEKRTEVANHLAVDILNKVKDSLNCAMDQSITSIVYNYAVTQADFHNQFNYDVVLDKATHRNFKRKPTGADEDHIYRPSDYFQYVSYFDSAWPHHTLKDKTVVLNDLLIYRFTCKKKDQVGLKFKLSVLPLSTTTLEKRAVKQYKAKKSPSDIRMKAKVTGISKPKKTVRAASSSSSSGSMTEKEYIAYVTANYGEEQAKKEIAMLDERNKQLDQAFVHKFPERMKLADLIQRNRERAAQMSRERQQQQQQQQQQRISILDLDTPDDPMVEVIIVDREETGSADDPICL